MPFFVIQGSFHLVGQRKDGAALGFEPDGDSMQFKPDKPELLDRLERNGQPYKLSSIKSTQLRFEGIDALELHFEGHHQPMELASASRNWLTGILKMNPVPYKANGVTVAPPVPHDGIRGYILSRALEPHGRPVSFVYSGDPDGANDGDSVTLTPAMLKKSLNYKSVASGNAYPLFYDTLFPDLRNTFTAAVRSARSDRKGIWKVDKTNAGLRVVDESELEDVGFIYPKVFRRLTSYFDGGGAGLAGFLPWLKATKEQVLDLTTGGFTHLDNMLIVKNGKLKLKIKPEQLVIVSAKTSSTKTAPWLAH